MRFRIEIKIQVDVFRDARISILVPQRVPKTQLGRGPRVDALHLFFRGYSQEFQKERLFPPERNVSAYRSFGGSINYKGSPTLYIHASVNDMKTRINDNTPMVSPQPKTLWRVLKPSFVFNNIVVPCSFIFKAVSGFFEANLIVYAFSTTSTPCAEWLHPGPNRISCWTRIRETFESMCFCDLTRLCR